MPKKSIRVHESVVTYEVDVKVGNDWIRVLETAQLSYAKSVLKFGDPEETYRIIKVTKTEVKT